MYWLMLVVLVVPVAVVQELKELTALAVAVVLAAPLVLVEQPELVVLLS